MRLKLQTQCKQVIIGSTGAGQNPTPFPTKQTASQQRLRPQQETRHRNLSSQSSLQSLQIYLAEGNQSRFSPQHDQA